MKFIAKIFVAAMVALFMACVAIVNDASDRMVIVTYFATAIAVAAALGVFDESTKSKYMSLKDGARSYDQAA